MLFSAYPSILSAASWPPAGKAGGCSDERGSIQKTQKYMEQIHWKRTLILLQMH